MCFIERNCSKEESVSELFEIGICFLLELLRKNRFVQTLKALSHQSGVLTAFKKIAEHRGARCANDVETLCNRSKQTPWLGVSTLC